MLFSQQGNPRLCPHIAPFSKNRLSVVRSPPLQGVEPKPFRELSYNRPIPHTLCTHPHCRARCRPCRAQAALWDRSGAAERGAAGTGLSLGQRGMFWGALGLGSAGGEPPWPGNGTCQAPGSAGESPRRRGSGVWGQCQFLFFLKLVHPIFLFVDAVVLVLFVCFKRKADTTFFSRCYRKPSAQHSSAGAARAAAGANRGEGERGEARYLL